MSTQVDQATLPVEPAASTEEVLLDISNMNKSFGGLSAIAELDLQVKRGQIYSIIGPNGAGKTTVFNVITGIYRPDRVPASFLRNTWGYFAMLIINTLVGVVFRYLVGLALGAVLGYGLAYGFNTLINQAINNGYGILLGTIAGLVVAVAIAAYLLPRWRQLRGPVWGSVIALGEAAVVGLLLFILLSTSLGDVPSANLGVVASLALFLIVVSLVYSYWVRFFNPLIEPFLINAENYFRPYKGKILLRGRELIGLSPDQILRQGVARTFQNIRLFSNMTVLENVMVGMHARMKSGLFSSIVRLPSMIREQEQAQERAIELLRFFGEDLVARKDDPASSLSYADKRRVEIARALASEPTLLLLDEPTAGMNEAETLEAMGYIRRLRDERGLTILLIEHKLTVTMGISDWISVLDYGRKIAEGLPEDIRRNERVIEAYLGRKATVSDA